MESVIIREKLHQFIERAEDKRVKVIYALFEDEIERENVEYSDDFKTELDKRIAYFESGGSMVSSVEMGRRLETIRSRNAG